MILNKREMQMARELARELVRVEKEKRDRETREAFELLGEAIRNIQNAYIEAFKPIKNAVKAMNKGFYG